jgi:signal transduction histidine kinase
VTEKTPQQLHALAEFLGTRRSTILRACRASARADPEQTTVNSLTREQFIDHIPEVLDAFERKLKAPAGSRRAAAAEKEEKLEQVKHGLHRWQQGYRLRELLHEWGHLHLCLFNELERFAESFPGIEHETLVVAQRELITLVNDAISESTAQYARMQQEEAAGHVRDLQRTLDEMNRFERQRAELIHQAIHDLRGNVQSVTIAAEVLRESGIDEPDRIAFANMVQQGTEAVGSIIGDLMDLARLEAGHEHREIAPFDAAKLLAEFCAITQSVAHERGLFLDQDGPPELRVEGDANKVRRIVQNLTLNALKYTERGGVTVSWGEESARRWWISIRDTGPGLGAGPGAPILTGLKEATASARESDEKAAEETGEQPSVLSLPHADPGVVRTPSRQQPGEGIGLSIVKRLCELLDASLELVSSAQSGTTFRVVLPRVYSGPPDR